MGVHLFMICLLGGGAKFEVFYGGDYWSHEVFWIVTPCIVVVGYQCYLHLHEPIIDCDLKGKDVYHCRVIPVLLWNSTSFRLPRAVSFCVSAFCRSCFSRLHPLNIVDTPPYSGSCPGPWRTHGDNPAWLPMRAYLARTFQQPSSDPG
jgi:hypothetical protein